LLKKIKSFFSKDLPDLEDLSERERDVYNRLVQLGEKKSADRFRRNVA